jgi:serine/threonine protein kinase
MLCYDKWHSLPLPLKFRLATDLVHGVATIHAANLAHRDIKPDNILMILQNGVPIKLAITDFGFLTGRNDEILWKVHLTPCYSSPEYWNDTQSIDGDERLERFKRMDIWGIGCVLYLILFGTPPYFVTKVLDRMENSNDLEQAIIPIKTLGQPGKGQEEFKKWLGSSYTGNPLIPLMRRMLDFNPMTRITIKEALAYLESESKRLDTSDVT